MAGWTDAALLVSLGIIGGLGHYFVARAMTYAQANIIAPFGYWQLVEEQSGERPIDILARILRMPYTLSHGTYVWPFAYDKQPEDLTAHEREILGDLADDFGAGSGYLGWRAGIRPDGTWTFVIAGD